MKDMDDRTREAKLVETLIMLADTLVDEYDVVDLLQTLSEQCSALLGATATGILLAGDDDRLEIIASSNEGARVLELLQIASGDGPCVDCYREGRVVSVPDIDLETSWPDFQRAALAEGFRSLHAVPLRLRERTIGSMNLFRDTIGELGRTEALAARALADVATIGILQERAVREASVAREQLQHALDSRVIIEQAKGVVSYHRGIAMDEAFAMIRGYARENRIGLALVAERIVARDLTL